MGNFSGSCYYDENHFILLFIMARIIGNLMKQRDKFNHLVIEATGLADANAGWNGSILGTPDRPITAIAEHSIGLQLVRMDS